MSITIERFLASDAPMALNPDFDGACPCNVVKGDGFTVEVHCWRTSRWNDALTKKCECPYSGVHVLGIDDLELAARIGEHMRDNNGWTNHTDWEIIIEPMGISERISEPHNLDK